LIQEDDDMTSNNFPALITEVSRVIHSDDMQKQMKVLLPPSVGLARFTEVTIAAIQNNPDVLEADRDSLYRACVAAARRGLLPDKREGALVVYKTNVGTRDQPRYMPLVQFMPMVEGIIKEMAKAKINAYAVSVHENDAIALWNDDEGQHVKHEPVVFGDRGQMVGVFAAAKTEDGRTYIEAMNLKDVEQVARRSKQNFTNKQTGALEYGGTWKSDFDRMAQKSALHRLRKRLPIIDEDVLQNLKDMEEETDIVLGSTTSPEGAASTPAPTQGSSSPPAIAAPAVDPNAQVLKPARAARKSRLLEGVVATAKANGQPTQQATAGKAPEQEKKAEAPAPAQEPLGVRVDNRKQPAMSQAEPDSEFPEYSEDDII
jgi:recombination protein RecT